MKPEQLNFYIHGLPRTYGRAWLVKALDYVLLAQRVMEKNSLEKTLHDVLCTVPLAVQRLIGAENGLDMDTLMV